MKFRKLGNTGVKLSAIGLGCMGMSMAYGDTDDHESLATLEKSIDLGINFWDTSDAYGNGKNEELLSKVLVPNRSKIFLATKFGFRFRDGIASPANAMIDGSPEWMKQAIDLSLQRLKTDVIDLYYLHRVDKNIPIEESIGAMADLVKEGKVRYLGLSEASPSTIKRANEVHPIAALQSEYSLLTRDVEGSILNTTRDLGIALVPYSPLSRGLMTNMINAENLAVASDLRKSFPRFQGESFQNNLKLADQFAALAHEKNCTAAQLAIAWVLAQGEDIIPIPGTKRQKYLIENVKALEVSLNESELNEIEKLVKQYPISGERYGEGFMSQVIDK